MATKKTTIATLGGLSGLGDPTLPASDQVVVPRVYGRAKVKGIPWWVRTLWDLGGERSAHIDKVDTFNAFATAKGIDCVLVFCQAGVTLQSIYNGTEVVGLVQVNTAAQGSAPNLVWQQANSWTVWDAIRRLGLVSEASGGYYVPGGNQTTAPQWVPGPVTRYGIQVINATSSPWGKSVNQDGTWSDITGAGSTPPAWAYLAGLTPADDAGEAFAGLCHIRFERLGLDPLTNKIPDIEAVIDGVGNQANCPPGTAIRDLLLNMFGIASGNVITNVGPDGTYASSADAYWTAYASTIAVNAAITGSSLDALNQLCQAVDCTVLRTGSTVKILANGDQAVGGYTPCSTAVSLDASDLISGKLLSLEIREQPDCHNVQTVKYKDPANNFDDAYYTAQDDYDIDQNGRNPASTIENMWVSTAAHASWLADKLVRNYLYNRHRLIFALPARYQLLEPGDLISITDGVNIPVITARITKITEQEDFTIEVEAWEWSGAVTPVDLTPEVPPAPLAVPSSDAGTTAATGVAAAQWTGGTTANAVVDPSTGLSTKAQTDLTNVPDGSVTNAHLQPLGLTTVNVGNYDIDRQLLALVLFDISRSFGSAIDVGFCAAIDDQGRYVATISGGALNVNGTAYNNALLFSNLTGYGDVIWIATHSWFLFGSNGTSSNNIGTCPTPPANPTGRSGYGVLCLCWDPVTDIAVGTPDVQSANIYHGATGGSASWSAKAMGLGSVYWECICLLPGQSEFLFVASDTNSNVVGATLTTDMATVAAISLPSNTGGTITSPRMSSTAPVQGVVCGVMGGKVLILTENYIWTATLGADLTNSANWTRSAAPWAGSLVPAKARATSKALLVSFASSSLLYATLDGVNWRVVSPAMFDAGSAAIVMGLGATTDGERAQVVITAGASSGNGHGPGTFVTSGVANEALD